MIKARSMNLFISLKRVPMVVLESFPNFRDKKSTCVVLDKKRKAAAIGEK